MQDKEFLQALRKQIDMLEEAVDGECGRSRSAEQLLNEGKMPEVYLELLRRIQVQHQAMRWVPIEVEKPKDGQAVWVRYSGDNWHSDHTLGDGRHQKHWRWAAAKFVQGRTAEEAERAGVFRSQDQWGNNLAPYEWEMFGPGKLFGHEVTHWAAITDPLED